MLYAPLHCYNTVPPIFPSNTSHHSTRTLCSNNISQHYVILLCLCSVLQHFVNTVSHHCAKGPSPSSIQSLYLMTVSHHLYPNTTVLINTVSHHCVPPLCTDTVSHHCVPSLLTNTVSTTMYQNNAPFMCTTILVPSWCQIMVSHPFTQVLYQVPCPSSAFYIQL